MIGCIVKVWIKNFNVGIYFWTLVLCWVPFRCLCVSVQRTFGKTTNKQTTHTHNSKKGTILFSIEMPAFNDICGKYGPEMDKTVQLMTAKGKGLLAADESTSTIAKRFEKIKIENVESNRQAYREMLFTTDKEYAQYISGVIMYEETLYQKTKNGKPFVDVLKELGIVPGIKVDKGIKEIYGTDGDTTTQGLDDLDKRVAEYYKQGARFAKWRAVFKVSKTNPHPVSLDQNAQGLARYAAICQANGLVPIVEPEVLVMEGDHDIERSFDVTQRVLSAVFKALVDHNVVLERMVLKPNMVLPGTDHPNKASVQQVAEYTVKVLRRTVPPAVPGIMFLSGGQTEEEAAEHLDAINRVPGPSPWALSFSYGRALQNSALKTWAGQASNVPDAQKVYLQKCKACHLASIGKLHA
jgi:fructose-bisphosphate aldolase class I